MKDTLSIITSQVSFVYFIRQVAVIFFIYATGFILVSLCSYTGKRKDTIDKVFTYLLAFPLGIALYIVSGLILLISDIGFNYYYLLGILFLFLLVVYLFSSFDINKFKADFSIKQLFLLCLIVLIFAMLATSGLISISFSNDSMYYYYAYPHELVYSGHLSNKYDTFLTDAGLGTAIINTLPFMFGFGESFGIQNFFNINFILYFFYSVFAQGKKHYDIKKSYGFAAIFTLLLITSTPFLIVSKWVLANVYFTEMMFIIVMLNYLYKDKENAILVIRSLLLLALSFIRIEGALFVGFIVMVYLITDKVKKKEVLAFILPVLLLQMTYFIRIFIIMHIYAEDTFMTKRKALIAIVFLLSVIIYGMIYAADGYFPSLKKKFCFVTTWRVILFALIAVNVALFIYDYRLFLSNVKVFLINLLQTGGWGIFPALLLFMIIIVPKVKIEDNYFDYFWIGFLLLAFAACFARGDNLRIDVNDSGNRVMLQIVPFVIYAFAFRFIKAFDILFHSQQE